MEYRQLPHGNEQISIIGLGTGSLMHDGYEEAVKTVETAIDQGINYIDLACAH